MSERTVPLSTIQKTEGGTKKRVEKEFRVGRVARTAVGVGIIGVDILAFGVTHVVIPILTKEAPEWSILSIVGHLVFLGVGFMMFDKETGLALFDHALAKLPGGKK